MLINIKGGYERFKKVIRTGYTRTCGRKCTNTRKATKPLNQLKETRPVGVPNTEALQQNKVVNEH